MTIAELLTLGWHPWYHDGATVPYLLQFRQHAFRFLWADGLCVVERTRYGTVQGRDFDATFDGALAKLCEREHRKGVTVGEWLRGLASTAVGG